MRLVNQTGMGLPIYIVDGNMLGLYGFVPRGFTKKKHDESNLIKNYLPRTIVYTIRKSRTTSLHNKGYIIIQNRKEKFMTDTSSIIYIYIYI